jgi:putative acetyltransferase
MISIRTSRPDDSDRVLAIWRAAVSATHHFVKPEDRDALDEQVQQLLPILSLWLAVDSEDIAVGFMSLSESHLGALFVDPTYHGNGVGRTLVEFALQSPTVLRAFRWRVNACGRCCRSC